ncbi:molybdopterin-binding oxidoreductase [Aeromonas cavernicola]|uniref:Molybdopterin-binding oxidoreductase n=1 Tax=Aeromonas cavernicola TaxID=1006623 RepID=A0A2H9U560_9GAMM|nr:molybdopterin-binding oxidoreductase [Aeromonas cavernicola]PJG59157.1 molybdopterin-binding oxidoreductase [Aeromonas cavernicola]
MKMLGIISLLFSLALPAMALESPTGPIILKVTGNINATKTVDGGVQFDLAMLQALPQHEIVTSNPWVDKAHTYKGPKLTDLLTAIGAKGKTVTLTALNSFQIQVDWEKVKRYDPILAWQDNGAIMRVRDKGPLWFMLPLDKYPELRRSEFTDMMIWQLHVIDIQH